MTGVTTKLVLEYDGTHFAGWAKQPGRRTVQGVLEDALAQLRGGDRVGLTVAGRTDAGVHASWQVASYHGEPAPLRGLNAVLPSDVAVLSCEQAPDGFDARRWATSRRYCYRVHVRRTRSPFLPRALWWPHRVDREALAACAQALIGTHDFTAFTPTETDHVRFSRIVRSAGWTDAGGDVLEFRIEADAFLRQMNRVLVGTMLQVAGGRRSVASFVSLLEGAQRSHAGPTAPPHGLELEGVSHGDGPTPYVEDEPEAVVG